MKSKATYLSQLREIDTKMVRVRDQLRRISSDDPQSPRKDKMQKRFENLEKRKTRILVNFDCSLRSYLERLESRYQDTSVVRVNNALCPGCHMKLPTKEAILLHDPNQYVICSFCGRIIVSCPVDTDGSTTQSH
ncbi:hypothetical protein JXQ70_17655 [bacterium]|nr:hypothetical protein [bacterium]